MISAKEAKEQTQANIMKELLEKCPMQMKQMDKGVREAIKDRKFYTQVEIEPTNEEIWEVIDQRLNQLEFKVEIAKTTYIAPRKMGGPTMQELQVKCVDLRWYHA